MSLFESGLSQGSVSLRDLLDGGKAKAGDRGIPLTDLIEAIARGGWPALQAMPVEVAMEAVADYLEDVCRTDINRVDGVRRDPIRVRRLLRSLARNVATQVAMTTLASDTAETGGDPLKKHTVGEYLSACGDFSSSRISLRGSRTFARARSCARLRSVTSSIRRLQLPQ